MKVNNKFNQIKIYSLPNNYNQFNKYVDNYINIYEPLYKYAQNKALFTTKIIYPANKQFIICLYHNILYASINSRTKTIKIIRTPNAAL